MAIEKLLEIIKGIIYLWAAIDFFMLSSLYYLGYEKFKPTPVINALQRLLFLIGVFFLHLFIMTVACYFNSSLAKPLGYLCFFFVLAVMKGARQFRIESLREKKMILPKKRE